MRKRLCRPAASSAFESLESRRLLSMTVKVDYSYDTTGFFNSPERRATVQAAVDAVAGAIKDHFAAIVPSGGNSWNTQIGNPSGGAIAKFTNPTIPADTVILYPGAQPLANNVLGVPATANAGDRAGDTAWQNLLDTRGRVAPPGGFITPTILGLSVSSTANWYSGLSPDGLQVAQADLYTVVAHEFGHALGLGNSVPWYHQLSSDSLTFTGPASVAAFGEPVPADGGHWAADVRVDGLTALMSAYAGVRKGPTRLDFAALQDIGYDVSVPPPVLGQYGSLSGYAYSDANANGKRDAGEGLKILFYLDANDDGEFNPGETSVSSRADTGYFVLNAVPAGTYHLVPIDQSKQHVLTGTPRVFVTVKADARTAVPDTVYKAGVPGDISGSVYDDANRNGTRDGNEVARAGLTAFLDTDNDGKLDDNEPRTITSAGGFFDFHNIAAGVYRPRVVVPNGLTQTTVDVAVRVDAGRTKILTPIGLAGTAVPVNNASLSGFTFDDDNKNGQYDSGETKTSGKTVFLDTDNDGVFDSTETKTTTAADGSFSFLGLAAGTYHVRRVFPSGYERSTPPIDIALASSQQLGGLIIGSKPVGGTPPPTTGTLSGFTFDDKNANGVFDSGDVKTSGKTVFLDLDHDGVLDSGEKKIVTAADGSYGFTGLAAGTYHVRRVFPSGYTYSTTPIDVTLAAGQTLAGLGIGSRSGTTPPPGNTASIAGVAFNDANKNGKYDAGDSVAPGKTVWLDLDDDGVKDANEPSVVTGNDGSFAFKTLAAGKYHVRRVFSPGYAESGPAAYVTLTSGQAAAGVLIGSKLK